MTYRFGSEVLSCEGNQVVASAGSWASGDGLPYLLSFLVDFFEIPGAPYASTNVLTGADVRDLWFVSCNTW